jgi:alpha-tubulin suppressor-like RCC1 family protein
MGAGVSLLPLDGDFPDVESKAKGDDCFRNGAFRDAVFWYSDALDKYSDYFSEFASDNLISSDSRMTIRLSTLFSNRSASFMANDQPTSALRDALRATTLSPQWPKGYFRAATAYNNLLRFDDALQYISRAKMFAPNDVSIIELEKIITVNVQANNNSHHQYKGESCLYTWGIGVNGQLGIGLPLKDKSSPTSVTSLAGKSIIDISCGYMHSVALTESGDLYAWGSNEHSQLGIPATPTIVAIPALVPRLLGLRISSVSCGAGHSIAIAAGGRAFAWGIGAQGQLGCGPELTKLVEPMAVQSLENDVITSINCGISHSIFLLSDGSIKTCGSNTYGQLSLAADSKSETDSIFYPQTPFLGGITLPISHVSCGGAHSLLVDCTGAAFACGSNSCGQLGLGTLTDAQTFKRIEFFGDRLSCAFCTCGEEFSIVITKDRSVYAL